MTVTQSLHLMNAREIHGKLTSDKGFVAKISKSQLSLKEISERLYLSVYNRFPTAEESRFAVEFIEGKAKLQPDELKSNKRKNIEDFLWAMLNTPEFSIQN